VALDLRCLDIHWYSYTVTYINTLRKVHISENDTQDGTARLKRNGTRVKTIFGHSAKRTSPFKLEGGGGSVQSTIGSRGVRISGSNGSNAGYTMFWGRGQDYWLPTPLACFPFTSPTVRHRVPSGFNWALLQVYHTVIGVAFQLLEVNQPNDRLLQTWFYLDTGSTTIEKWRGMCFRGCTN